MCIFYGYILCIPPTQPPTMLPCRFSYPITKGLSHAGWSIYCMIYVPLWSSGTITECWKAYPDSKVHGANMGPIWGREDPGGPNVGPMYFAIWVIMGRLLVGVQKLHTDSKVHGANMGSIWGWQDPCGPHVGPMNFVIWLGSVNFHWAVRTCSEVDMAKHC